MPGLDLQRSIASEMEVRPPRAIARGQMDNLVPASDEDEQFVEDAWNHVASRLYRKDEDGEFRITEKVERMVGNARPDQKADALIMASMPFIEVANETLMQSPTPPPDEAGDQLLVQIVDAVMEIADETGAAPYSDELAETVLIGVRKNFFDAHPELYGDQPSQPGGQPNGGIQPQPRPGGSGGGTG